MSDSPSEGQFLGTSTSGVGSAGSLLRSARERAGMSLDELSTQTKIAQQTLEALERDDFSRLGQPVYARGYLRKIAKVLNTDEAAIVAAYDAQEGPKRPPLPQKMALASGTKGGGRSGASSSSWWIVLIGAALLGGGLYFWVSNRQPSPGNAPAPVLQPPPAPSPSPAQFGAPEPPSAPLSEPAPAPAPSSEPAAAPQAPASAPESSAPASTPPAGPPSGFSPAPPATPTAPGAAPAATPGNPAPASQPQAALRGQLVPTAIVHPLDDAGSAELSLTFSGQSWVQIRDARNKVLLNGHIAAGRTETMTGVPPYSVSLGRAQDVNVKFKGEPVDTTPYLNASGSARFLVPAPEAAP